MIARSFTMKARCASVGKTEWEAAFFTRGAAAETGFAGRLVAGSGGLFRSGCSPALLIPGAWRDCSCARRFRGPARAIARESWKTALPEALRTAVVGSRNLRVRYSSDSENDANVRCRGAAA